MRVSITCSATHLFISSAGATELDTQRIARTCTPSVMLIMSEGSEESLAQGTGFVLSADGVLVTNHHVIEGGKRLVARSHTGGIYPVMAVICDDAAHDVAVLKIAAKDMQFLQLDQSTKVEAGEKIAVIGNPVGLESTVTEGIVSAVRSVEKLGDIIQISAAISPGSSGSPVLNADGKVIGVATFKLLKGEALNFAIPAKQIKQAVDRAKETPESETNSGPYLPNPLAKGSSEEDAKALHDPAFARAKALETKKDYFGMLNQAKALITSYPNSALTHRVVSDSYYYLNMMDDAIGAAKIAIDLDPNNPRGWNNLAILYGLTREKSESLQVYTHAVKLAPDDAKLLIDYASAIRESNPKGAKAALMHARNLLAEDRGMDAESLAYPLRASLANGLRRVGELREAYRASSEAVNREPNQAKNWEAYAVVALDLHNIDEVRQALNRANELDDNDQARAQRYEMLGRAEYESGNLLSAIEAYEYAYKIRPNDSMILTGLILAICKKHPLTTQDAGSLERYLSELRRANPKLGDSWTTKVRELLRRKAESNDYLAISPEFQAQLDAQGRFEAKREAKQQQQQAQQAKQDGDSGERRSYGNSVEIAQRSGWAQLPHHVIGIEAGDYLNIRQGPGHGGTIARLRNGEGGIIIGEKSVMKGATSWRQVSVNGVTGWAEEEHLAPGAAAH